MDTQLRCQQNYEKVTIKDFSSLYELNDTRSWNSVRTDHSDHMGKCFSLHGYRDLRRRSCHLGNRNDPPLVKHLQKERVDWRSLKVGLLCLQSLCKEILKGKLIFVEYLIYFIISEIGNIVTTYRDTLTPPVKASLVSMYLKTVEQSLKWK